MAKYKDQKTRATLFIIECLLLIAINKWAFGSLLPPPGEQGLWFYSALLNALLANSLITPFYSKPRNAISYAFASIIALYIVNDLSNWLVFDRTIFWFALSYFTLVLLLSFAQIYTKDSSREWVENLSNTFRILSEKLGSPNAIFSVLIIFALLVFHRNDPQELIFVGAAWIIVVVINPLENLLEIWRRIKGIWVQSFSKKIIGEIIAYQSPRIVLIRQFDNQKLDFGKVLLLKDPYAPVKLGVTIDYTGRDESILLRVLEIDVPPEIEENISNTLKSISNNTAAILEDDEAIKNLTAHNYLLNNQNEFVGLVGVNTSVEKLYMEVVKDREIAEGRLVEVDLRDQKVLYQVIDGLTKEETIKQKNKYGYARAEARKIGVWDDEEKKFKKANWFPQLNSPVYLKSSTDYQPTVDTVGRFPNTNYVTEIDNINELVTHNTAILGILGIGKSMLSIELVERMISEDIKVVCIDLTNQYAEHLSDFYRPQYEQKRIEELQNVVPDGGRRNFQKNVEEGGGVNEFKAEFQKEMESFLDQDNDDEVLKIYNPTEFEVWRQTGGIYEGEAAMASLTPTELTQIISESVLEVCQEQGMTDKARVCLVFEEAHSLVPEWTSVAVEGDKAATNGTARAILQGRKFGMGCLLITQRTANVTKTILNQCNTIFAMRTFDQTGKDFLANYIGEDYANILQNLEARQAVFYGKASSCDNPVQLRLNDQDDFREVFREEFKPPEITDNDQSEEQNNNTDDEVDFDEIDDDLPF